MEYEELRDILLHFNIVTEIAPYGNGHINDTYIVETDPKYILQKINMNVFLSPDKVMSNILKVTQHLRKKILLSGGDPDRETLTVIKTIDGENFYQSANGDFYRMYKFIENAKSFDKIEDPKMFFNAAKAFGKFQRMLSDFDANKLYETIPHFHDTALRVEALKTAISEDRCARLKNVTKEVEFALGYEKEAHIVCDLIASGEIPLRVTHNDTKLNNVMLDQDSYEGVCVIDLDTVMPGSLLYDFGDALRFGANTAAEDERDLSKVSFDLSAFETFTDGYLSELLPMMTEKEIELLPFSVKMLTYECGIRFLTDYLNGDTYFKIHRKDHNLDRCRTQFALIRDIEKKNAQMVKIVERIKEKYKG